MRHLRKGEGASRQGRRRHRLVAGADGTQAVDHQLNRPVGIVHDQRRVLLAAVVGCHDTQGIESAPQLHLHLRVYAVGAVGIPRKLPEIDRQRLDAFLDELHFLHRTSRAHLEADLELGNVNGNAFARLDKIHDRRRFNRPIENTRDSGSAALGFRVGKPHADFIGLLVGVEWHILEQHNLRSIPRRQIGQDRLDVPFLAVDLNGDRAQEQGQRRPHSGSQIEEWFFAFTRSFQFKDLGRPQIGDVDIFGRGDGPPFVAELNLNAVVARVKGYAARQVLGLFVDGKRRFRYFLAIEKDTCLRTISVAGGAQPGTQLDFLTPVCSVADGTTLRREDFDGGERRLVVNRDRFFRFIAGGGFGAEAQCLRPRLEGNFCVDC